MGANVLFRTIPSRVFDDGDILHIWTAKDIAFCHAHKICFQRTGTRKLDEIVDAHGTLPQGGMVHAYQSATYAKRFRQDGNDFYIKDMAAGVEYGPFSGTGDEYLDPFSGKKEVANVKRFLRDRKAVLNNDNAHGKVVFGPPDKCFWYGGLIDGSAIARDAVWNNIERLTPRVRTDAAYRYYPGIGTEDLRTEGFAEVDDIRDGEKWSLLEQLYDPATVGRGGEPIEDVDGKPIVAVKLKERRHKFRYEDAATLDNLTRLRDKRDRYDGRSERLISREETHDTIRRKRMDDTDVKLPDDSKTFSKTER